jgi:hypothetical protein
MREQRARGPGGPSMSQAITELGTPERLDTKERRGFLGETVAIAFVTGLIYVMAGAYQQGFQDAFGFTYISLDIKDVVEALRRLLIPLLIALSGTIFISYVFMLFIKTNENNRLTSAMFLIAPVSVCAIFYWWYGVGHLDYVDAEIYWLLGAYYIMDVSIWRALYRLSHSSLFQVPLDLHFRIIQVAIFSLFLVVLTYSVGEIVARTLDVIERCPDFDGKASVLVDRTNDIAVCAQADFEKRLLNNNFFYFKLPSNGTPESFRLVSFGSWGRMDVDAGRPETSK